MWRLECFVIRASHWHTCKFHLLGMRPQIAAHNNPRTLPWTFIIFERKKNVRLDLRVADRQIDLPQEWAQGTTSKNGLQHCSLKSGAQHMPRSHRTAWQHSRKAGGWSSQGTQRCSASILKEGTANYLGSKDTHQRGNSMMHRDSIPAESNFWEQCKWWTCTGGLTLLRYEFQHIILSKINWRCSAITIWVLCNLSNWTDEHYESFS